MFHRDMKESIGAGITALAIGLVPLFTSVRVSTLFKVLLILSTPGLGTGLLLRGLLAKQQFHSSNTGYRSEGVMTLLLFSATNITEAALMSLKV